MDSKPISTAPSNVRILVNNGHRVFIARCGAIRWYDDADRLIQRPELWMPLPEAPSDLQPATKPTRRARASSI